jgi:hypothetical protein
MTDSFTERRFLRTAKGATNCVRTLHPNHASLNTWNLPDGWLPAEDYAGLCAISPEGQPYHVHKEWDQWKKPLGLTPGSKLPGRYTEASY